MRRLLRGTIWVLAAAIAAIVIGSIAFQPPASVRGTWISQGYGFGFDIGRFRTRVVDLSPVHCATSMEIPSNTWLLDKTAGYVFAAEGDRLTVHVDEIINPIHADRAPLPALCDQEPDSSPGHSYDVFWHSFAEHYPNFDVFGVDWDSRRDPGPLPDDAALRSAILSALDGIEDGHVMVAFGPDDVNFPMTEPDWIDQVPRFAEATEAQVSALERLPEAGITFGWLADNIAYVRFDHMDPDRPLGWSYGDVARATLTPVLEFLSGADGMVVDIRWNSGGTDPVSLGYAELFATEPWSAGSKQVQIGPGRLGDPVDIALSPRGPALFDGPVVLLTSEFTVSAGEIFAMAMRELPQVTVMGTRTNGSFSDLLFRRLPNGVVMTLSHQTYLTPDGVNHEGPGLPPDLYRPVDVQGFQLGRDSLLEEARQALASGVMPAQ